MVNATVPTGYVDTQFYVKHNKYKNPTTSLYFLFFSFSLFYQKHITIAAELEYHEATIQAVVKSARNGTVKITHKGQDIYFSFNAALYNSDFEILVSPHQSFLSFLFSFFFFLFFSFFPLLFFMGFLF
jgi:hypothetical protein